MADAQDKVSVKVEVTGAQQAKAQLDAVNASKQNAAAPVAVRPPTTPDLEPNSHEPEPEHPKAKGFRALTKLLNMINPELGHTVHMLHLVEKGVGAVGSIAIIAKEAFVGLARLLINPIFLAFAAVIGTIIAAFEHWNEKVQEAKERHLEFVEILKEEAKEARAASDAATEKQETTEAGVQKQLRAMGANQAATRKVTDFIKQVAEHAGATFEEASPMIMDAVRQSKQQGRAVPDAHTMAGIVAAAQAPGVAGVTPEMAQSEFAKKHPFQFFGNLPEESRRRALETRPGRHTPLGRQLDKDAESIAAEKKFNESTLRSARERDEALKDIEKEHFKTPWYRLDLAINRALGLPNAEDSEMHELIARERRRIGYQDVLRRRRERELEEREKSTINISNSVIFGAPDARRGESPRGHIQSGE